MDSDKQLTYGEVHFSFIEESRPRSKWKAFIIDKLHFIGVSLLVFTVSYVALNYQAIYANLDYQWQKLKGFESPLTKIVEGGGTLVPLEITEAQSSLLAFNKLEKSRTVIPPLNIEVYPPDMRIIIPKINKNIPVIGVKNENLIARQWNALEKDIQESLKNGVIHYPGTALPGEGGNVVITGHSSFYAWDAGRFKDVFALLHELVVGDKVVIFYNQRKYIYEIFDISVVYPSQVDVLGQTKDDRLTLITCTPLGTNLKRLIVTAKLIDD